MVVVSKDFQNPLASRGRHGYAVHKAVALVIALLAEMQARQKGFARLRMDRHALVVHDPTDRPSDRLPQMRAALSQATRSSVSTSSAVTRRTSPSAPRARI